MRIKIINVICLFLLVIVYDSVIAQDLITVSPENNKIQYEGRIDFSDSSKPVFSYPGVSIKAGFIGTSIKIKLRSFKGVDPRSNYFNVFIDDTIVEIIEMKDESILETDYSNLSDKNHILELTKRTESLFGKIEFLGFEINGVLTELEPKFSRKIEFIGNSITCGYGNEDISTNGFDPRFENNYLAYGAVCARELNARYQAVSYSGRGVIFNYNCFEGELIPDYYEKYIADEDAIGTNKYDHNSYNPDVIVINLGTNDHSCNKINDKNFVASYINFIKKLKIYHPYANILCLTGPMNYSSIFKTRIERIVEECGGDNEGIFYFHQTGIIDDSFRGGHGHPNTKMAEINGKEVAAFIESKMLFNKTSNVDIKNKIKKKRFFRTH